MSKIPGLFTDYHRNTAIAVRETDTGVVEYLQRDGSKIEAYGMGSDQFHSMFRPVETTRTVAELAKNMLEVGAKMTVKVQDTLRMLMQVPDMAVTENVVSSTPGQVTVVEQAPKPGPTAQELCESALPFDPDPVPAEDKPKRHRRSKAEIEAAKAAKAPVEKPLPYTEAIVVEDKAPVTVPEPVLPATLDTLEKVAAWKEARLQEVKREMEDLRNRVSVLAAYKQAQDEINTMREELEALKKSLGV